MRTVKLQDEEWMKIQAFLRQCPQVKVGSARKCRRFVEAALWILRSGAQWRLLPGEYGLSLGRGHRSLSMFSEDRIFTRYQVLRLVRQNLNPHKVNHYRLMHLI